MDKTCGTCKKFIINGGDCRRSVDQYKNPKDINDNISPIGGGCDEWCQTDISACVDISVLCTASGAVVPKLLGDEMLLRNEYMTIRDNQELYIYMDGVYRLDTKAGDTKAIANKILDIKASVKNVNEGVSYVMHKTRINRDDINCAPFIINMKNGMYDVLKDELLPHNPKYKSTIQIDTTYDPSATCPAITKFLYELMEPIDVILVIQFIGYCLIQDVAQQKALLIDGSSKNGKSTFIKLINSMVGDTHISGESLEEISKDRFSTMQLSGKLVNAHPDLSANAIVDTSVFKTVVTETRLTGQGKGKDKIMFDNICTHIFACNTLPDVDENELAYFRRFLQVTFPNTFDGIGDDKDILNKITIESEKSGFFNLCMVGLRALLNHGEYCDLETTESNKKRYLDKSNPVGRFFDERTAPSMDDTPKDIVYWGYVQWCNEQKIKAMHDNPFWKIVSKKGLVNTGREPNKGLRTCEGLSLVVNGTQANQIPREEKNAWVEKKHSPFPSFIYNYPGTQGDMNTFLREAYIRAYTCKDGCEDLPGSLGSTTNQEQEGQSKFPGNSITQAHSIKPNFLSQRDIANYIYDTIGKLKVDGVTKIEVVANHAIENNIPFNRFRDTVKHMKADGRIFEPKEGYYKCV